MDATILVSTVRVTGTDGGTTGTVEEVDWWHPRAPVAVMTHLRHDRQQREGRWPR